MNQKVPYKMCRSIMNNLIFRLWNMQWCKILVSFIGTSDSIREITALWEHLRIVTDVIDLANVPGADEVRTCDSRNTPGHGLTNPGITSSPRARIAH